MSSSTTESALATDQLLAFQRIAREGSFSRAAFSLDIGQPAVSSRIRALEQALGGPLFTRGRRVALTALGETFLPYVERALAVLDEGMEKGRLAGTGKRGRVTVAALGSLAGGLVGPALAELLRSHSDVEWMIRSGNHESVLQALWDGLVELGHAVAEGGHPKRGDGIQVAAAVDVDELVPVGRLDDDGRVLRVAGHLCEAVPDDGGVALGPLLRPAHGERC